MDVPEYKRWLPYFSLLSDANTPTAIKRCLILKADNKFILAIEELLINVQNYNVPLNEATKGPLLSLKYRRLIRSLSNPKSGVYRKRHLLDSKRGLAFLSDIFPKLILEADQIRNE